MKIYYTALVFGLLASCGNPKENDRLSVRKGKVTVAVDESFRPIADAQMQAYQGHYPEAEFEIIYTPEQKAISLMLQDSADLVMVSRELTNKEQAYYRNREMAYQPAIMALDAVVLITNKSNDLEHISISRIEAILKGEPSPIKFVFDHSSSSNLNLMLKKFNIENVNKTNIYAAEGTKDVFDYVENNENVIGLVGLNWISDKHDKPAVALKERIKIIGIERGMDKDISYASLTTIKNQEYPFVKIIYLHTTQNGWGVAMGFIRFACTQVGQLVVEKMGLQPYYLIPKMYQLGETDPINVVE
ncbi:MAG: phosphate transport system substrate-binding protein [Arcticibacterium sp.]|jgi:phosphate transport system substrate-binding protein